MIALVKNIIGTKQDRRIKKYYKSVEAINKLEPEFEALSNDQLKQKTEYFKQMLAEGKSTLDLQVEAFAVVREASKRVLGKRHFDVQLIGGMVLAEGNIAEMPTGEGKTLVATLTSYLVALEGRGVHIITVNEYLAKRDCEQMGQIHEFLGLTVGLNIPMLTPEEKLAAYQADITYGVGSEFGFDHLRDNMAYDIKQRTQRPFHFAIIDEVDSVLIDEAKTPLIIAGKTGVNNELSYLCARIVRSFVLDTDFEFDEETKTTNLTEEGISTIERGFGIDNLYDLEHQTLYHYVIQALRANVMFTKDVDYIIKEGKILLVDMFTGRPMEGRSLSNGLHQAIEAKENLELTEENKTQASITIQNYFRLYPTLSGMTGTAKTEEKEFQELYQMDVIQIPTNKPIVRIDLEDKVYTTIKQKYKAVTEEVRRIHKTGQPILIGTTSIIQSEMVARFLKEEKLQYEILNAKSLDQEIELISSAGQKWQITIATNMAGRGTDIVLGEGVAELGGLYVIGTERHESRRIDNQLKGRSGRQGDPGTSQFFISIEDEMFRRFAKEEIEKLAKSAKTDNFGQIQQKNIYSFIDRVQRICEGANYSVREYNLKLDNIMDEQRNTIYKLKNRILTEDDSLVIAKPMIRDYFTNLVDTTCHEENTFEEWDLKEISKKLTAIKSSPDTLFNNQLESVLDVHEIVKDHVNTFIETLETYSNNPNFQIGVRRLLLEVVDQHWLKHIEAMDRLKEGIGLRSYSQEDPMRQFEREGLELFTQMYNEIVDEVSINLAQMI